MNIEFYTDDKVAAKHFPPLPASQFLPEWFKDLPRYTTDPKDMRAQDFLDTNNVVPQTVKGCQPFMDYMVSGYVIRAAADIALTPDLGGETKGWWWSSSGATVHAHPYKQCPVALDGVKNEYLQILNFWRVKTPPGYSCLFYQPEFLMRDKVRLFPGIVDTDDYDASVHFPGTLVSNDTTIIHAGAPLMVVFPFIRHHWTHSVQVEETKISASRRLFERGYKTLFHKNKKYT
jgi:hypothetical protein